MDKFVAYYNLGGFSSNPVNYDLVVKEKEAILAKYFSPKELRSFRARYQKQNTVRFNLKTRLYKNKFTYAIIKFYVKLKGSA